MEIYQLRAFVAVARHGSFTRAADGLHLSQPTVSGQIKALEEELGLVLFERATRGVVLTTPGAELLPRAESILAEIRGFIVHAQTLGGRSAKTIRMGLVSDAKFCRLGEVMAASRTECPDLEIEALGGSSGWVMNSLREGKLDCGYFVGSALPPNILGIVLSPLRYRVVAPAAWSGLVAAADWEEIAALPWVVQPELGAPRQLAREMFREHGVEPKKLIIADQEDAVVDLVGSGAGMALLHERTAHAAIETGELILWGDESRLANLWFCCLEQRQREPAVLAVTEIVEKIWA